MSNAKQGRLTHERNAINITCESAYIQPHSMTTAPLLHEAGIIIKVVNYDLDQVLCCMLEEYGEETLIERIKTL